MDKLADYCNFETIQLEDDYEGKVIATLINSKKNTHQRPAVLYVHGFIDYFFQLHEMQEFEDKGYDFYALDLRKYGRSKLPHQHPCFAKDLEEYFDEITYAIKKISGQAEGQKLILMGHSTGCITTSLYLNKGECKDLVSGLILNGPFLDLNIPEFQKPGLKFLSSFMPAVYTYSVVQRKLPAIYGQSIHKDFYGEWDYELKWKPIKGFPTYFTWIKAVVNAQVYLQTESNIKVPIFILHAEKSLKGSSKKKDISKTDAVLNVEHMKQHGPKLGGNVEFQSVENGLHDIFLSNKKSRDFAFAKTFEWMAEHSFK